MISVDEFCREIEAAVHAAGFSRAEAWWRLTEAGSVTAGVDVCSGGLHVTRVVSAATISGICDYTAQDRHWIIQTTIIDPLVFDVARLNN